MRHILKLRPILFVISVLVSFPDEAHSKISPSIGNFISATMNYDISYPTLKAVTVNFGKKKIAELPKFGVKSYTLVYETKWKEKVIKVSGLILIPTGITHAAPILSIQHGTTFIKDEAPSASGRHTGMELFASAGYIVLMPDFIGYGSSSDIFHPYYDKGYSAMTVIDMIKAAKEFLSTEKIAFNEKLFLAGYSEGGYVTLATAEEIEKNPSHNLHVTAVAAGAGGYDLTEMLKSVTTESYYSYPAYLAFVLMAYNNTYAWNQPMNYFFKKPYATALTKYMDGTYGGWTINSHLTTTISSLLDTNFYSRLKTPQGESKLKLALKQNSVTGWKTKIPIRLYHGTKDEIIPYGNSEATLKSFHTAGSRHITLTSIPGGNHGSSFVPMMELFIPWFMEQK